MRLLNQSYILTKFNFGRFYGDAIFLVVKKKVFIIYFKDHETFRLEVMVKLAMNIAYTTYGQIRC